MTTDSKHYFVCGIGGSGMAPIASLLKGKGHKVSGSDRAYDQGQTPEKFQAIKDSGFALFPQDGSGITSDVDFVVASAAVENRIPDVAVAREQNIPVLGKADILATFLNTGDSIAIAGTSGKTTVTGMTGFVLRECGSDPAMMSGGHIVNLLDEGLKAGNAMTGQGVFVAETDESDGSVELYSPFITVLNNISFDHKPMAELRRMFTELMERTRDTVIINLDDEEAAALSNIPAKLLTFSVKNDQADFYAKDIQKAVDHVAFTLVYKEQGKSEDIKLHMPGLHNVSNALAAVSAAVAYGVDFDRAAQAISKFKGMKRRFEVVGTENNITVIDDFGHNPDKIAATLSTLKDFSGRVIVMFQPHGFGPTKMLKDDLIKTFKQFLDDVDILLMPEIYYAGGTADKSISSRDIINPLAESGLNALFFEARNQIKDYIKNESQPFDRVVIMGARDDTLPAFARSILDDCKQRAA